jgi:hypothetical protein
MDVFSEEFAAGAVMGLPVHETSQGAVLFPPDQKIFRPTRNYGQG